LNVQALSRIGATAGAIALLLQPYNRQAQCLRLSHTQVEDRKPEAHTGLAQMNFSQLSKVFYIETAENAIAQPKSPHFYLGMIPTDQDIQGGSYPHAGHIFGKLLPCG